MEFSLSVGLRTRFYDRQMGGSFFTGSGLCAAKVTAPRICLEASSGPRLCRRRFTFRLANVSAKGGVGRLSMHAQVVNRTEFYRCHSMVFA